MKTASVVIIIGWNSNGMAVTLDQGSLMCIVYNTCSWQERNNSTLPFILTKRLGVPEISSPCPLLDLIVYILYLPMYTS